MAAVVSGSGPPFFLINLATGETTMPCSGPGMHEIDPQAEADRLGRARLNPQPPPETLKEQAVKWVDRVHGEDTGYLRGLIEQALADAPGVTVADSGRMITTPYSVKIWVRIGAREYLVGIEARDQAADA
jgi:hypothetical protein